MDAGVEKICTIRVKANLSMDAARQHLVEASRRFPEVTAFYLEMPCSLFGPFGRHC